LNTGSGRAVVWVGAEISICERRGALGVDTNARKTLVVSGTSLTVANVPHSRCRGALLEETKSRFAVFSIAAVFSLHKLVIALVIETK